MLHDKPVMMFFPDRKNKHGYWMDSVRVFSSVDVQSIDYRIERCVPGHYSAATQTQLDSWRAEYMAMKDAGVTHILDKRYGSAWLRIEYQQYTDNPRTYCEANIQLTDTPSEIQAAAKLLARIEARMKRIDPHHGWQKYDVAIQALTRLCDHRVERYHYRAAAGYDRSEYVIRNAEAMARVEYSLVAG